MPQHLSTARVKRKLRKKPKRHSEERFMMTNPMKKTQTSWYQLGRSNPLEMPTQQKVASNPHRPVARAAILAVARFCPRLITERISEAIGIGSTKNSSYKDERR